MPKWWPKSAWIQAILALPLAAIAGYFTIGPASNAAMTRNVREYPHDGLDGLSAYAEGIAAGFFTLIGVFLALCLLQRILTKRRAAE
ncbi:MAG: hypothetical protein V4555_10795 [Acidobacteriota bacterium]